MAKKHRKERSRAETVPELPEGRPMPNEASPNGVEGADPAWPGGQSNLGEVINPGPPGDHTYSASDFEDAPRVDVVARFLCERCGQAFHNEELLTFHVLTAHKPRG